VLLWPPQAPHGHGDEGFNQPDDQPGARRGLGGAPIISAISANDGSAEFTAVPGWGGVAMGYRTGGALRASRQTRLAPADVWLIEAFVAVAIAAPAAATKHTAPTPRSFRAWPQIRFLVLRRQLVVAAC